MKQLVEYAVFEGPGTLLAYGLASHVYVSPLGTHVDISLNLATEEWTFYPHAIAITRVVDADCEIGK
jgi:hypothetical protein